MFRIARRFLILRAFLSITLLIRQHEATAGEPRTSLRLARMRKHSALPFLGGEKCHGGEAETGSLYIPLNVLTESPDSGYLRYLILNNVPVFLPEM